jgi:hypothetical protein
MTQRKEMMQNGLLRHGFKVVLVAFMVNTLSCTSTTVVNSRPQGARVYIDGAFIGEAPATHSDTVTASTKNMVRLEMPGYKETKGIIAADQWVTSRTALSIVCGLFTLVGLIGLLWSTEYRPSYEFTLTPEVGTIPTYQPAPGYGTSGYGTPQPPQYQPAPVQPPPAYQPPPGQYQPPPGQYQQPPPQYQPAPGAGGYVPPPPPPPRAYDPDGLLGRP